MHYQLKFYEYALFSALHLYINHNDLIDGINADNFPLDKIKPIIPDIIFNSSKRSMWVEKTLHFITRIIEQLEQISTTNQSDIQSDEAYRDSFYKDILTSKLVLAQMVVLNSIKTNELYGVRLYFVQTYNKTIEKYRQTIENEYKERVIQKQKEKEVLVDNEFLLMEEKHAKEDSANKDKVYSDLPNNIYLGVKYDKIIFLTPSKKELIRTFSHHDIQKILIYPASIQFKFKQYEMEFRFNTSCGYEISQLIYEYKEIMQI